jgi:hypothetical protein
MNLIVLCFFLILFSSIQWYISGYSPSLWNQDKLAVMSIIIIFFLPSFVIVALSDLIIKYESIKTIITKRDTQHDLFNKTFYHWNIICLGSFLFTLLFMNIHDIAFFIIFVVLLTSILSSVLFWYKYKLNSSDHLVATILSPIIITLVFFLTLFIILFLKYIIFPPPPIY